MKRAADHDRYVGIMKSIARAEELQQKDNKKEKNEPIKEEQSCFNCERKKSCKQFNGKMIFQGTYSIGGEVKTSSCSNWKERKSKSNDPKQIKSLLKKFSKLK